ncbi:MAG: peptidylprolyl isomerase [Gammaproteobacteria bacterium]|nr:peptidylprolyl isomerase [Gammaproteobacteria bacterium]
MTNVLDRGSSLQLSLVFWLAPLAAMAFGNGALANPEPVDRIVAIVNDDVVLASEVVERYEGAMQRLREEGQPDLIPQEALVEQIVERLILESIQLQEAETRGVVVDDETLTRAVTDYAQQGGMTIDQFIAALDGEGLSYRGFRDTVRRQLTLDRVQREVVNRRVYITEQDLTELLASPFFAEQLSDEYRLGHILLPVASGASQSQMDAVRVQAESLVRELRDGADFAATAVEHSSASTALEGGDLGWRRANRLPSLFAEAVLDLSPGTVLEPMQNASGFHIVKLLDRRGASQQTANETLLRHILVEPSAILSDAEAKALVTDLRGRVEAGEDFGDLAMEYSDDPGSALAGGDLGWTTGDEFVPEFRQAMAATAAGELSEPFQSEFGWHVLEVLDRREQDASEEARRDYATRVLHAQRFDERLEEWLTEIRDEAFVDQRLTVTPEDESDN